MTARWGILGGTFNPIHIGHLIAAETAVQQLNLDRVLWIPNQAPPYKSQADILENRHRLELIRRAIAPYDTFQLCEIELNRPGPSYAVDTWRQLQSSHSEGEWYWILGLDSFLSLPRWHRSRDLIPQCTWLVAPRPAAARPSPQPTVADVAAEVQQRLQKTGLDGIRLRWQLLDMPLLEISSSLIRQYCGDRRSVRYLVPDAVWHYIEKHQLYRSGSPHRAQ